MCPLFIILFFKLMHLDLDNSTLNFIMFIHFFMVIILYRPSSNPLIPLGWSSTTWCISFVCFMGDVCRSSLLGLNNASLSYFFIKFHSWTLSFSIKYNPSFRSACSKFPFGTFANLITSRPHLSFFGMDSIISTTNNTPTTF